MIDPDPEPCRRDGRSLRHFCLRFVFGFSLFIFCGDAFFSELGAWPCENFVKALAKRSSEASHSKVKGHRGPGVFRRLRNMNPLWFLMVPNPHVKLANQKYVDIVAGKDPNVAEMDMRDILKQYIQVLADGNSPEVSTDERADYFWIVEMASYLGDHNPFNPESAKRIFSDFRYSPSELTKPFDAITVDDVFELLKRNSAFYFRLLRTNPDVPMMRPQAERALRGIRSGGRWIGNSFGVGTALTIVTGLAAGYMLFFTAGAQQLSFQLRHWMSGGERSAITITDSIYGAADEYAIAHQAAWNFIRSGVRDDGIHIPGSIAAINTALDNARFLHKDPELEKYWVRILYDIDLIIGDFTGVKMGKSTRDLIDKLYELYDADGSIRREFSELKSKSKIKVDPRLLEALR